MAKKQSNTRQLRSAAITVLIIIGITAMIILLQSQGGNRPPATPPQMTLDPQIITNLTDMPGAVPLSGESAEPINELKAMVDSCPDYSPERRSQMEQHITWLINPALIPPDIIIALGANPPAKLVFGMATYTSIQWQLADRPPDSCLLPIGVRLNEMLVAEGEAPFSAFAGSQ